MRERLPDRRASESFDFEAMKVYRHLQPLQRRPRRRIVHQHHKAGNAVDTLARDLGIAASFALQHGANAEALRHAVCRDSAGRAIGPLGVALDHIASLPPVTASLQAKKK